MEKIMQILKKKVEDETAAFVILGAMIVTFAITICVNEYILNTRVSEVNADIQVGQAQNIEQQENENSEDFETLNEITSQEDLEEDEEQEDDEEENKNTSSSTSSPKYYIKVNYGAQVVTIYTKDEDGEYTVPVKAMVCSTGTYTPTSGVYTIGYRWEWLKLIGNVYGHYVTQITGDILFHSVPYLEKGNLSSLEWWEYDKLGTKASLGCVRLTAIDALWIYNNISSGTKVEFYSSSDPGPLGKPTARKISDAPSDVKGWDPTDPDKNNPWPEYLEELENQEETNENENNSKNEVVNEVKNTIVDNNNNIKNEETVKNEVGNNVVNNDIQENNELTNNTEIDDETEINSVNNVEKTEINNVYVSEIV